MRYTITGATIDQVRQAGGRDIRATRYTGHIFATLTDDQIQQLRAAVPGIKAKEVGTVQVPRQLLPPGPASTPTYSMEDIISLTGIDQLRNSTTPPLYGGGVNIAIIDTGIRESHELINGRVVYSQNFTDDPNADDGYDHGTGVAAIAVTVAPNCQLLNLKVIDNQGEGTDETVVNGIDEAIALQQTDPDIAPQIINLSLGAQDDGDLDDPVRVACRAAIAQGIWVIAGAGNDGPDPGTIDCPACDGNVLAVGSAEYLPDTNTFTISSFSGRGPTTEGLVKPDVVFFGENIEVASSASDTATVAKSGTSFSAPYMSGGIALYLEAIAVKATGAYQLTSQPVSNPYEPNPTEIDTLLPLVCIKPAGAPIAKDDDYGYGMPMGTLVMQSLSVTPATEIGALVSEFMIPIVGIAMVGMVAREAGGV